MQSENAPEHATNQQEPDDDGEPRLTDEEEIAQLDALQTAWDRPDVKALLRQREQPDEPSQE